MSEFLHMGGYAAYVWSTYGIAALVLVGLLVASLRALRTGEATLRALEGSRPARRRRPRPEGTGAVALHGPAAEVKEG